MSGLTPATPAGPEAAASGEPPRHVALIGTAEVPAVLLSLYSEKRPGLGEDAPPLCEHAADGASIVAGVFDGLGGSGATQLETPDGRRSSAYVASRLVRDACRGLVTESAPGMQSCGKHAGAGDLGHWLRDQLADRLRDALAEYHDKHGGTSSRVRSRLLRPLPTTLAMALVRSATAAALDLDVFWAGDSRVYLLTPEAGLQQLTSDDLMRGADAMQNLGDDGRMSNLISADGRFHINLRQHVHSGPAVVIAATDGCFDYVRTPVQLEGMLLSSLRAATADGSWEAWRDQLRQEIVRTAADDATLAMVCLGWRSLPELAQSFAERGHVVGQLVNRLARAQDELTRARSALEDAKSALDDTALQLWIEYRETYERLLPEPVPSAGSVLDPPDSRHAEPESAQPAQPADLRDDTDSTAAEATAAEVAAPETPGPPSGLSSPGSTAAADDRDSIIALATATGLMPDEHTVPEPSESDA